MTHSARFHPGQIVHHLKFDYRGVVVDVDPQFNGSQAWYQQVAASRPPKDQPWYHVLVDNAEHRTYVAERHLEASRDVSRIHHPEIEAVFTDFSDGRYHTGGGAH